MRITAPILAFASLTAGQGHISSLISVFGGLTSDFADGASVITSAVANLGDAFDTITSNIVGGIETATSNIEGAFATATSRVGNALDDDINDQDDTSSTSGGGMSQNAALTALPSVEAGFVAAEVALGVMV